MIKPTILFTLIFSILLSFASVSVAMTPEEFEKEYGLPFTLENVRAVRADLNARIYGTYTEQQVKGIKEKANKGDVEARYELATIYRDGKVVPQDYKEATKWYLKAAEQGHTDAQNNLAFMYEKGQGVLQDYEEAMKWYRKAAETGSWGAQLHLGDLYYIGHEVKQDFKEAYKWYIKFIEEHGNRFSHSLVFWRLASMYYNGNGVPQDYKVAMRWYLKAAEQGDADAQNNLAFMYEKGQGVPQDYKEAVKWYRKAAEQGHASAQFNLAVMYYQGYGVLKNEVTALAWDMIATMNGDKDAKKRVEGNEKFMERSQILAAQAEAKQILAEMERKQKIADTSKNPTESGIAPSGYGSGLCVQGGYILTAYHVVENAQRIFVNQGTNDHPATVAAFDKMNDLAILRVGAKLKSFLLVPADPRTGLKVFTVGYPNPDLQGHEAKYTTGDISSLSGLQGDIRLLQISTPIQPGNSGGPLFNSQGGLIGIVVAKLSDSFTARATGSIPQNVNYAIKTDYLLPLLKSQEIPIAKQAPKRDFLDLLEEVKQATVMIKVY